MNVDNSIKDEIKREAESINGCFSFQKAQQQNTFQFFLKNDRFQHFFKLPSTTQLYKTKSLTIYWDDLFKFADSSN